jgi:hypothetical protein
MRWVPLLGLTVFCLLLGFTTACTKGKPNESKFVPGEAWLKDKRARIERVMTDRYKKTELMALVDQTERDVQELDLAVQTMYGDLASLDRDYNSSPDDFRKAFSKLNAKRQKLRTSFIDARFKMKNLVTPDEWKKLTEINWVTRKGLFIESIRHPGQ